MKSILKKAVSHRIIQRIWIVLALLIILCAVLSSIFRSLTPWAYQYKRDVEQQLSRMLSQPVTIQTMETGWYWLHPVIKLKQLSINEGKIHLGKLYIGINVLQSLWQRKIQPGLLYVDDVHLVIRKTAGKWQLEGISNNSLLNPDINLNKTKELMVWLANQGSLIIKQVSLTIYFDHERMVPVRGLDLSIVNHGSYYKLKGDARLVQAQTSLFKFSGELVFNPSHLENTKGQIYFAAKNIAPADWQQAIPSLSHYLESGRGDLEAWMELNKGAISSLQAQINFKQLGLHLKQESTQKIQSLQANMAWRLDEKGWTFQADKIRLDLGGVHWPENKLSLQWDKEQHSYRLFVKTLLLESISSLQIEWPPYLQKLLLLNPRGTLSNSQILVKDNQPAYVLTRFDQLGWTTEDKKIRLRNLAGVLNWQPQEGRLELDSENLGVYIKGYPRQSLSLLNGALDWKELNNGLRISIERFVASQPDLTLSTEGVLDQVTKESLGLMRLNIEFSGNNLQQWVSFIPPHYLKPKLYTWLKEDLKRIAKASGKIHINGLAKDFPFDNHTGEFSIVSHAVGGELTISPKWQLISDVEGYIRFNNRNLDIDITHADFQGVPVNQMNLRIEDIGKNQENLLIRGMVEAPAEKITPFLMASPLKDKLWALKSMRVEEMVSLNLNLEIPLHKDNQKLLAQGDVKFANNKIVFHNSMGEFKLSDVTGPLHFDEKGITDSTLTANAMGHPFHIKMQSIPSPNSYTSVVMDGELSVDALKNHFNSPVLSRMNGEFLIQSELKLKHGDDEASTMTLKSDLQGLAIQLPAPLGKTFDTKIPLEVNLDFKNGIRVKADYDDHLSADVFFQKDKKSYAMRSGQIRLGSAQALDQNLPGLAIVGALDDFDLKAWADVFSQLPNEQKSLDFMKYVRIIQVSLAKLTFLKQQFDNISIKAKLLADKSWSFGVKQKNISGDLTYQPSTHSLSGFINHLHIEPIEGAKPFSSTLHPKQIPNLNLRIDDLSFGTKNIGNMTLKSQSSANQWLIHYCRIESPFYQLDIAGDWVQKEKTNKTNLQLKLQIHNLAKSLERWNIIPAVDASQGEMEFRGGWNDSLVNFSLSSLNGSLDLKLKNGVITNLSPETESKLGLGKLLSILSLQTIPRRLKLDFSDLSHKGFSFDEFQGHFDIRKGIMSTQDSNLEGPVAAASMRGSLDLVKRIYDLNLQITPHITASLPIVATIAGGPVAGVAMWIANKMIINQGMQKISGYSYKISGPWNQPIVQQLKIIR